MRCDMKKSRCLLHISAITVLVLFIICTFVSAFVGKNMKTVVEIVMPHKELITINDNTSEYLVVPSSSVVKESDRSYVYVVESSRGVFGEEYNVHETDVGVLEEHDNKSVLIGKSINLSNFIVVEPTNLVDGQNVQLKEGLEIY